MGRYVLHYRCPECHHIVEKGQLFDGGCPICGWVSPLKVKNEPVSSTKREFGRRESLVDIFDESDYLRVVVGIPGVAEDDIKTRVDLGNYKLIVSALGRCFGEIDLPRSVSDETITSYKNGVLEVKVKKHDRQH